MKYIGNTSLYIPFISHIWAYYGVSPSFMSPGDVLILYDAHPILIYMHILIVLLIQCRDVFDPIWYWPDVVGRKRKKGCQYKSQLLQLSTFSRSGDFKRNPGRFLVGQEHEIGGLGQQCMFFVGVEGGSLCGYARNWYLRYTFQ